LAHVSPLPHMQQWLQPLFPILFPSQSSLILANPIWTAVCQYHPPHQAYLAPLALLRSPRGAGKIPVSHWQWQ
jgi:hypothetical protein